MAKYFPVTILTSCMITVACATTARTEQADMKQYQEKAYQQVGPIWRAEVQRNVKKLALQGLKPNDLVPPENEVLLGLSISRDGTITDVRPLTKSRFTFLNKAASQALLQASPLAPPPASCFKSEKDDCNVKWTFVVDVSL